jgi:hypothetical protein
MPGRCAPFINISECRAAKLEAMKKYLIFFSRAPRGIDTTRQWCYLLARGRKILQQSSGSFFPLP